MNEAREFSDLVQACKQATRWAQESLCRRFVATHQNHGQAGKMLLDIVETNGNLREAVRLTRLAIDKFPNADPLHARLARSLLNDHQTLAARAQLEERAREGRIGLEEMQLLGDLLLTCDPPAAVPWFEKICDLKPDDRFAKIGILNAGAIGDQARKKPSIGFFLSDDWHFPIQISAFEAAMAASLPSFMTNHLWMIELLKPDAVIVSNTLPAEMRRLRRIQPRPFLVNTRHGIADKNYSWFSAGAVDRVCATSRRVADESAREGFFDAGHFWATGYPQMDGLFRKKTRGPIARNVLFAPTWTPDLSAGAVLGHGAVQAIRGNDETIRVTIKPHPHMRNAMPLVLKSWRQAAQQLSNVHYVDDVTADLNALMADAEILVSDVSSVAQQFLALDRPIICVVNPATAGTSVRYAPGGIEWRLHSAAMVANDIPQTTRAVRDALNGRVPPEIAARRRALAEHLFGDLTDGCAGERIIRFLREERVIAADTSPSSV